jgi:hypothetical protein
MHNLFFELLVHLLIGVVIGFVIGLIIGLFWFGRSIVKQSIKMIESTYQGAEDEVKHFLLHLFTGVMHKAVIETQDLETFEKKAIEEAENSQKSPKED